MTSRQSGQRGVTLIEILVSISIMSMVTAGVARLIDQYQEDTKSAITAQHLATIGNAAQQYIKDNYATVQANATATSPALITVPMLIGTGYLPAGFSSTNNYNQTACVLVLEPVANMLDGMVVTEGGTAINDINLGGVAGLVGANGGGIYSTAATILRGAMGGWSLATANYAAANNAGTNCSGAGGTPLLTAGHPVMALWFANGDSSSSYLRRDAVAGRPDLNTMNTPILLGAGTVNTVGAACATTGALGRDNVGALLSCQAGTWQTQGSAYWKDPVANVASLPACNAASAWQTRVVQTPTTGTGPRAHTCNGATWQALAVDDTGSLIIAGTLTAAKLAGNLQVTSTATEGTACAGDGSIAQSATKSGLILSCQSGVWSRFSAGPNTRVASTGYTAWRWPSPSVSCNADETVMGGGGACYSGSGFNFMGISVPSGNGWYIVCDTPVDQYVTGYVYAVCAKK